MATQFLGVMRSSELGSARGVKRERGESSRLDPRVARLSGKHSLPSLPRIDLLCVFQVHESRTHSAIHSRRTADNGLAIQRRDVCPLLSCFLAMMMVHSSIMSENKCKERVCGIWYSGYDIQLLFPLLLILGLCRYSVSKVKRLLVELAAEVHGGLAGAEQERLGSARHHVRVVRVAPRALQHAPHVRAA